jgi:hypothetical protein
MKSKNGGNNNGISGNMAWHGNENEAATKQCQQ